MAFRKSSILKNTDRALIALVWDDVFFKIISNWNQPNAENSSKETVLWKVKWDKVFIISLMTGKIGQLQEKLSEILEYVQMSLCNNMQGSRWDLAVVQRLQISCYVFNAYIIGKWGDDV